MLLVLVVNTYSYTLYGLWVFQALHTLLLLSNSPLFVFFKGGYTPRNAGQSANAFDTQKRGYLNRAKVTEGKKRVK